jgi:hypothetical protein
VSQAAENVGSSSPMAPQNDNSFLRAKRSSSQFVPLDEAILSTIHFSGRSDPQHNSFLWMKRSSSQFVPQDEAIFRLRKDKTFWSFVEALFKN